MVKVFTLIAGLVVCDGTETGARAITACEALYARTATTSTECEIKVWPSTQEEWDSLWADDAFEGIFEE